MHDFWNQVALGNPVRLYVIVAAAILVGILLKRLLSKLFASLLYRVVKKMAPDSDKSSFVLLIIPPLETFLVIFITIVSLDKLHFPERLNFDIYEISVKDIIHALAKMMFIASFFWLVLRNIDFISMLVAWRANKKGTIKESQHVVFFRDFLKAIVSIIGLLMILKLGLGFQVDKLLAGLGLAGAALALAAKESIENLIASFIIFFDKPFNAGDLVRVNNISGTVEKIGLRSTRIRTDLKTYVTVPNKQMVDSIVDNLTLRTQRKAEIRLRLSLSVTPTQIEQLLQGMTKILSDETIMERSAFFQDIADNAMLINVDYFTPNITLLQFNQIKQRVNLDLVKLMELLNIRMSGASVDVNLMGAQKNKEEKT
jgi:MscS family membrane protein